MDEWRTKIIDEWDIRSEQSCYRRKLSELAVTEMERNFWDFAETICLACIIEHPANNHICMLEGEPEIVVDDIIFMLMNECDWKQLNVKCCIQLNFDVKQTKVLEKEDLFHDEEWMNYTKDLLVKTVK